MMRNQNIHGVLLQVYVAQNIQFRLNKNLTSSKEDQKGINLSYFFWKMSCASTGNLNVVVLPENEVNLLSKQQ